MYMKYNINYYYTYYNVYYYKIYRNILMLFVVVAVVVICEENGVDAVFGGRLTQKNMSHNVDNSAL